MLLRNSYTMAHWISNSCIT